MTNYRYYVTCYDCDTVPYPDWYSHVETARQEAKAHSARTNHALVVTDDEGYVHRRVFA